jgi:predicted heme/steroid binding protein
VQCSKVTVLGEEKKFTVEELAKYDGKNGNPAYVAYSGKVYDVTESSFWVDGDHLGSHQAGKDLTVDMEIAPHNPDDMERFRVVGILV